MNDQHTVQQDGKERVILPYYNVRNISSPEDKANNRIVYVGHAPLASILVLPIDENVRDYIVDAGKRRKRTQVHRAILSTLQNRPDEFSVLNSGITIVARDCEVDEKSKILHLTRASIINGAQTQGVIRDFFESVPDRKGQLSFFDDGIEPHIKYEVIVTTDNDLIAEVSIARNFQNDVKTISIVSSRGHLDELERRFQRFHPDLVLRKKETDVPYPENNIVDTERLMQVLAALIPEQLWLKDGEFNKVYTYSQRAMCLKDFEQLWVAADTETDPRHEKALRLYQFYLDVCGTAYDLYEKWKSHSGFIGTRLRSIRRDSRGNIEEVPDGIVFPILASLSEFAEEKTDGWVIEVPYDIDDDLIDQAKIAFQDLAKSNPNVMGKSKACYAMLAQTTSLVKRYSQSS